MGLTNLVFDFVRARLISPIANPHPKHTRTLVHARALTRIYAKRYSNNTRNMYTQKEEKIDATARNTEEIYDRVASRVSYIHFIFPMLLLKCIYIHLSGPYPIYFRMNFSFSHHLHAFFLSSFFLSIFFPKSPNFCFPLFILSLFFFSYFLPSSPLSLLYMVNS